LVFNACGHFITQLVGIDSQQFNKEAYLDLSKPYQQNNPQPPPKKDNQATTILKNTLESVFLKK
jgi:hypothetical protein